MKSWTRTLNLDDAHTLLALAVPGTDQATWTKACHDALPDLSMARRRELVRLLREGFLLWRDDGSIDRGLFLRIYNDAPASGQIDLVGVQPRFEAFCDELGRRFGWDLGPPVEANKSTPAPVSDALRSRIALDNALDIEFYEFADTLAV